MIKFKFKKKRRMRILSARIFSKFFGGKIEIFEQWFPRQHLGPKIRAKSFDYKCHIYNQIAK